MKPVRPKAAATAVSPELLKHMAEVLKLLAHPHRLHIVHILEDAGRLPVFEITARLGIPQAAASQHLNAMRRVGLLRADREGKAVWYAIAETHVFTILDCLRKKTASAPSRFSAHPT